MAPLRRQIIDYWHEMDWWETKVFKPLDRLYEALHEEITDGAAKLAGAHGAERVGARRALARVERRAAVEREYYVACEAQEQVRALYQPLRTWWTDRVVRRRAPGRSTTVFVCCRWYNGT